MKTSTDLKLMPVYIALRDIEFQQYMLRYYASLLRNVIKYHKEKE